MQPGACYRGAFLSAAALLLAACGGGGSNDGGSDAGSPPSPPPPPIANNVSPVAQGVVPDIVYGYALVTLDGRLSTDPDGTIVSYLWEQNGGDAVSIRDAATARASFVAPQTRTPQVLGMKLTVRDNQGGTGIQNFSIELSPSAIEMLRTDLLSVEFYRPLTTIGHTNSVSVNGMPLVGDQLHTEATLSGPISSVSFRLISASGESLSTPNFEILDDSAVGPLRFGGLITVPSKAFYVEAIGETNDGRSFALRYPRLFEPQQIAMSFRPRGRTLSPGATLKVAAVVENRGMARRVTVRFSDAAGLLADAADRSMTIDANQTVEVPLNIQVPLSASLYQSLSITSDIVDADSGAAINTSEFKIHLVPTS